MSEPYLLMAMVVVAFLFAGLCILENPKLPYYAQKVKKSVKGFFCKHVPYEYRALYWTPEGELLCKKCHNHYYIKRVSK